MAEFVHEDVIEHILIRLNVKNLIRCKSVCKSWHSLITSSPFINRHLNHRCNKDHYKNQLGHRRIIKSYNDDHHLVGSSNGLVCISVFTSPVIVNKSKVIVGNPLTREVKQLKLPPWIGVSLCWGFGYDSSRDDYKVFIGAGRMGNDQTRVRVLSLKSNVWRVTGGVEYTFVTNVGILCNGALHWIVKDQKKKILIISFDLSTEEFKEIPQPDDARYQTTSSKFSVRLGILKECLCVFYRSEFQVNDVWLMKNYNVIQSWELVPFEMMNYDFVYSLRSPKDESVIHDDASWFLNALEPHGLFWNRDYIDAPLFVDSLVSPHVNNE